MSETGFDLTMWGAMEPDVYGGETCDQVVPRWMLHTDGGKGDEDHSDTITLDAKHFPPGTTIEISEPRCPECDIPAGFHHNPETGEMSACECGFDWPKWVQEQYS